MNAGPDETAAASPGRGPSPPGPTVPLRLRANIGWVFAGTLVYNLAQWGMLIALARLGSTEMVGRFALGLAIANPILYLTNLDTHVVLATDATRQYAFGEYLALRLLGLPAAGVAVTVVLWVAGLDGATTTAVLAITVAKGVESLSFVYYGLFQQAERLDRMARSLMWRAPTSLVALTVTVALTDSVAWASLAMGAAWLATLVAYDMSRARALLAVRDPHPHARPRPGAPAWDRRRLAGLARLSLPAGLARATGSTTMNIPRYLIQGILDSAALGIFAAISYVMRVMDLVANAVGNAALPRLAVQYTGGRLTAFRRLLRNLVMGAVGAAALAVAVAALVGEWFLEAVYGGEFGRGDVLVLVVAATGLLTVAKFLSSALVATRYLKARLVVFLLAAAMVMATGVLLIPDHGLIGAAWSMILGFGTQVAASLVVLRFASVASLRSARPLLVQRGS